MRESNLRAEARHFVKKICCVGRFTYTAAIGRARPLLTLSALIVTLASLRRGGSESRDIASLESLALARKISLADYSRKWALKIVKIFWRNSLSKFVLTMRVVKISLSGC